MEFKNGLDYDVISYSELLEIIKDSENHLLVGNGFNYGLGIDTGYRAIFNEMISDRNSLYHTIEPLVKKCNYDLELLIGELTNETQNDFLKKFITNKIKYDFMVATQKIVKKSIKNVYAERNEGIYMLFMNFTNYFTLNFDSFLYLLLLNFKEDKLGNTAIATIPSLKFIESNINQTEDGIYNDIKDLRKSGTVDISSTVDNNVNQTRTLLSTLNRDHFVSEVKLYGKKNNKQWSVAIINRVVKYILQEEKNNNILKNVNDGFIQGTLFEDGNIQNKDDKCQNLFFLHGAFHIYKSDGEIKKITQSTDKALYKKLEEILSKDERDIVAIFQSSDKEEIIRENEYLTKCLNKLDNISGSLVIIGCSLSDNDSHIFSSINNSNVENIYISSFNDAVDIIKRANNFFPNKKIILFDAETISYYPS